MPPPSPHSAPDPAEIIARLLSEGGDARIAIDPETGLNQYFSAPRPSRVIAYASSTANDVSGPAFMHAGARLIEVAPDLTLTAAAYSVALERLRTRIRAAYLLGSDTDVVFAASGTDLEYVGLALAKGRGAGILNILLGADEVGSGCGLSARARFFASETALGLSVTKGDPIGGDLPGTVELVDVPVRGADGAALGPHDVAARFSAHIAAAAGRHALVHVVHGSKTGLILPDFGELDRLIAAHRMTIIVDACQARITGAAIADYLARGCIVLLTGSKFMGGPPFSGFALVPRTRVERAAPLPRGFASIFRRAEFPAHWPAADILREDANLGLLLRLEASIFELERFQALKPELVERVILAFHAAVRTAFVEKLGGRRIAPYAPGGRAEGDAHPIEMRSLSTIDISRLPGTPDFDEAKRIHRALVDKGVRLGQPVKCVKLADGRWGGTLRVGLSMPQISDFALLDDAALEARLAADMDAIASAIEAVCAP